MAIHTGLATAALCTALAIAVASPAHAQDPPPPPAPVVPAPGPAADTAPLNGGFIYFLEGKRWAIWVINSGCDPMGVCTGKATSSRNWDAPITRMPGGAWMIERDSPTDGWVCPDGTTAPAHYSYLFDPATLTGTLTYTKHPGACGDPTTPTDQHPVSLIAI